jgi:hypothetical protein
MRAPLLAIILAASAVGAQAPAPRPSCKDDPNYHRLDFWIGDWDVKTPAGGLAGHSKVEQFAGGCGLLENWTPANGGPGGKSLNTWNASAGQLQQYWVGGNPGGTLTYMKGTWSDTSVVYLAESTTKDGKPFVQRLTFALQKDGRVRQLAEASADGAPFKVQYDFYYSKKS